MEIGNRKERLRVREAGASAAGRGQRPYASFPDRQPQRNPPSKKVVPEQNAKHSTIGTGFLLQRPALDETPLKLSPAVLSQSHTSKKPSSRRKRIAFRIDAIGKDRRKKDGGVTGCPLLPPALSSAKNSSSHNSDSPSHR